MGKIYGLSIGDAGVEFSSLRQRTKAVNIFVQGSIVKINNSDIRYTIDQLCLFGTYERDNTIMEATCHECRKLFPINDAPRREYEYKYSYSSTLNTHEAHICDECLAKKEKEVFDFKLEESKKIIS